jgi:hypothetical protein
LIAPPSSRSVEPRLAALGGVMRDTVGAIHNLQHLLGSVKVGPKALSRVLPDVHASCNPMIEAVKDLVAAASVRSEAVPSSTELASLVVARMRELEQALEQATSGALRASDRLNLEGAVGRVVKDLDGALELVELVVEASATGRVPVDVTDVVRESANRPDTGSGRGRRVRVSFSVPPAPLLVRVNPRLALRLFAFAVAAAGGKDVVHTTIGEEGGKCYMRVEPAVTGAAAKDAVTVPVPPLIDLSLRCASEVARSADGFLDVWSPPAAVVVFPIADSDHRPSPFSDQS